MRSRSAAAGIAAVVLVAALSLSAVLRHAEHASPGVDAMVNLSVGRRVAAGLGPTMPDGRLMTFRAPVWPVVIGAGVWAFGDPGGADLVRILVVLLVVGALVALARQWYGSRAGTAVGVLAVVLALAAPPLVDVLSDWFADGLAVAVALAGLAVLDRSLRRGSARGAVVAGLLFGVAALTKESAAFVAIGPVVAAVAAVETDGWRWARPAAIAATAGMALVTPWLWIHAAVEDRVFLTSVDGGAAVAVVGVWTFAMLGALWLAVGHGRGHTTVGLALRSLVARAGARPVAFVLAAVWVGVIGIGLAAGLPFDAAGTTVSRRDIVLHDLVPAFGLPLLAVVGLGMLVIGVATRRRSETAHLAALAGVLPIFVLWPLNGSPFVARNALVGVVLVHLAAARGVVATVMAVVRARHAPATVHRVGAAVLAAVLVFGSLWAVGDAVNAPPAAASARAGDLDATAAWIGRHVASGRTVMGSYTDWTWISRANGGRVRTVLAPWTHVRAEGRRLIPDPVIPVTGDPETYVPDPYGDDWLALTRSRTKGFVLGLTQHALLRALEHSRSRFLVVTQTAVRSPLAIAAELRRVQGLARVARFGDSVIFRVRQGALRPAPSPSVWIDDAACRVVARPPSHPGAARSAPGCGPPGDTAPMPSAAGLARRLRRRLRRTAAPFRRLRDRAI